ncbi:TPA: hypothetical protein ACH3X1_010257 [Trebouxia sp. C0004]
MVAKSGNSPAPRSLSQIELSDRFSHQGVDRLTLSSSDDFELEAGMSTGSKDQHQESLTLLDVEANEPVHQQPGFSFRELAKFFGPGLLTCIAYVDPGNLEADLQAGGFAGYALLWLFLVCTIMGFAFQCLSSRLGIATGLNLAQHCGQEYPKLPRYLMWFCMEIAIIGADIQEVIGSAIAIALLSNNIIPLWAGVLVTAADAFVLLLVEQWGVRQLEAVFGIFIAIMAGSFGVMYNNADIPQGQVLEGLVLPRLPKAALPLAVGTVGALIMPHNMYLQSAVVQSRPIAHHEVEKKQSALRYVRIETAIALACSFLINLFIVSVFAKGFFGRELPEDFGLQHAGEYLASNFGASYKYIWGLGLLAAGQASTMSGTYTGQFVMSGFLNFKMAPWKRSCVTRTVAIVPTLVIAVVFQASHKLDQLNQLLNILQSIMLPFAIIPVVYMTSQPRIMGKLFTSSKQLQILIWTLVGAILAINAYMIVSVTEGIFGNTWWLDLSFVVVGTLYYSFVAYLTIGPNKFYSVVSWLQDKGKTVFAASSASIEI